MGNDAQLRWEKRGAPLAAAAAIASGLLLIASSVVRQAVVLSDRPVESREVLRAIDEHPTALVISGVIQAASSAALGLVLWYLARAIRHRRPGLPKWVVPLALLGPLLFAAAAVAGDLSRVDAADQFVASGAPTEDRADDLLRNAGGGLTALVLAGTLGLAFSMIFVSINSMRVGLLSRFMGILGAIIGALYVLAPPLTAPVGLFWVTAVGLLFLGRWPGGRGPAWETGEAIPWPQAQRGPRRGEEEADAEAQPPPLPEPEDPATAPQKRKRKKKRR